MDRAIVFQGDCLEALRAMPDASIDSLVTDPPSGIGFMRQDWDLDKGGRDAWIDWLASINREAYRVLKPGSHGLVWALPRTAHWTAMALELAGFEVRECVIHVFLNGMLKGADLSKEIDKLVGAERPVIATVPQGGAKFKQAAELIDNKGFNDPERTHYDITAPGSDAAKQWDGWKTCLRPGHEIWWLVRKPIAEKTIARNVLRYGTGAINAGACKIGDEVLPAVKAGQARIGTFERTDMITPERVGRWPTNLLVSHDQDCGETCAPSCSLAEFERQGAGSKFFYVPKPQPDEREMGLEDMEETTVDDGRKKAIDNPYQRGKTKRRNIHPTIKPVGLMRHLVTLITPPGGLVLDCFCGSGTTGMAAVMDGFSFIGIEQNPEYVEIARKRIAAAELHHASH